MPRPPRISQERHSGQSTAIARAMSQFLGLRGRFFWLLIERCTCYNRGSERRQQDFGAPAADLRRGEYHPIANVNPYTVRTPHRTVSPRPGTPPGLLYRRTPRRKLPWIRGAFQRHASRRRYPRGTTPVRRGETPLGVRHKRIDTTPMRADHVDRDRLLLWFLVAVTSNDCFRL